MRTCIEPVCGSLSRSTHSMRAIAPSDASAAAPPARGLAFPACPVVSPDIPATHEPAANMRTIAALGDFLMRSGVIRCRTFPRDCAGIQEACQSALTTWLALGDLKCFTPAFELRLIAKTEHLSARRRTAAGDATDTRPYGIEISWKEASVCHWGVGAGLDYLEQCVPMLGSTILDLMERKGSHAYPLFTPGLALDEASYLYWRGENDETLVLDEDCGDNEMERAAMAQDMVTRADVDRAFPTWALDYHRPRLPAAMIDALAREHTCDYVRRAARLAGALHGTKTTAQYSPEQDGPFIGFGAVLCWREGDLAVQISDDYASLAWQGEYCEEIGKVTFALKDPASMRQWARKIRPNLRAIGLLDDLIWHLAARE
jgi:PRTRC genetic system protein F